ncbi:hypothetical protein F4678DRAFT_427383 [Xylaria arbuscula]|nr:hypothetical protein F4678DRAFT_427383 [Xylaria arbuscula]
MSCRWTLSLLLLFLPYLFIFVSRLIDRSSRAFDTRKSRRRSGIIERYLHRQAAAECANGLHPLQVMRRDESAALDRSVIDCGCERTNKTTNTTTMMDTNWLSTFSRVVMMHETK